MRPKKCVATREGYLFRARLIINIKRELVQHGGKIDWDVGNRLTGAADLP